MGGQLCLREEQAYAIILPPATAPEGTEEQCNRCTKAMASYSQSRVHHADTICDLAFPRSPAGAELADVPAEKSPLQSESCSAALFFERAGREKMYVARCVEHLR